MRRADVKRFLLVPIYVLNDGRFFLRTHDIEDPGGISEYFFRGASARQIAFGRPEQCIFIRWIDFEDFLRICRRIRVVAYGAVRIEIDYQRLREIFTVGIALL